MNYQRKVKKGEGYIDILLKMFQPFIEPGAVPVFQKYIQWKACQKKREEELENNIPGKREHPSEE
jgi:hypothetical protein